MTYFGRSNDILALSSDDSCVAVGCLKFGREIYATLQNPILVFFVQSIDYLLIA